MQQRIAQALIGWYEECGRTLPWRMTQDAYCIWLSEVILQQTRVQQGLGYYERFVARYPDIRTLAAAPEEEVLKLWQGLGYYSRARNLHAAAKQVVEQHDGVFPATYDEIRALRGVGPYTAAAIASLAYGLPHAVVDGNVYRVLARLFDIDLAIDTTEGQRQFATLAEELLDKTRPAAYNQAIMDFGALQCTPQHPDCTHCPLAEQCLARAAGTVAARPVKQGRTKIRDRYFNYLHLTDHDATVLHRRGAGDIWQGLYEFPLIESTEEVDFLALSRREEFGQLLGGSAYRLVQSRRMPLHQLSHQRLHAVFHRVEVDTLPEGKEWCRVACDMLGDYAVARLTERYLREE